MARARRKLLLVLAVLGRRGNGGFVWDSRPGCTILLLGRHSKEAQRPASLKAADTETLIRKRNLLFQRTRAATSFLTTPARGIPESGDRQACAFLAWRVQCNVGFATEEFVYSPSTSTSVATTASIFLWTGAGERAVVTLTRVAGYRR
jgi:hypothetical protein